ncbi:putative U-box domain-containing protein 50 [Salvia miltiorrhiza]|uniref:putative U-box domain-containing protein 50 n=1 Tax=Salvia miltiorrhiza TaxID=226208 RepID=UPI0025ABA720|nr:putative U-box domain-containing protein 50 [Salvia miltiorrhiza]
MEKVCVAIGTEGLEGFSTLQWALRRWSNHRILILHAPNAASKHYVYTPLGKLRSSSVSEEKLKLLDKTDQANADRVLAQYIAFCGRVEAQVMKMEIKEEEPLHKQIVEAISNLGISKLVMSLAFMKPSSSPKSRGAISGTFYVVRNKPSFCELFVICQGQRIFLRDDGFMEDDKGRNHSVKNWLGRMFPETSPTNHWDKCRDDIEHYAHQLLSLHQLEGDMEACNSTDLCIPQNMDGAERIEVLKRTIRDAQGTIQLNRKQANIAKERREKAQRAIDICNARAEELQTCLHMETVKKVELNKMLDGTREEIVQLESELHQKRSKLDSVIELQKELSQTLHQSSSARVRAELKLEEAVKTRADMVPEIEELRKHKDVLQRRIEFCKEKDAIAKVSRMNGSGFAFREFTAAEIIAATEDFSDRFRVKSAKNVYRGRINHITVAVKMHNTADERSLQDFTTKVKLHSQVQHPNILAMTGFCSELSCIVHEYMHNGTLHDALFSSGRSWKRKNQPLAWHARIRIAAEICAALGFLHKVKPNPIIHGNLKPSKILLDRFNVAKIYGLNGHWSYNKHDIVLDIQAFGNLVLQLLTGNYWSRIVDTAAAIENLDRTAGEWPMDLAIELSNIATSCLSKNCVADESMTTMLVRDMNDVKRRADQLVDNIELPVHDEEAAGAEDSCNVAGAFFCPIYQEVMQNPHLAADGFSYELEAIDEWLKTGHDTSPMTNLRLKHKSLVPNHTLRSLIEEWRNKRSTASVVGFSVSTRN